MAARLSAVALVWGLGGNLGAECWDGWDKCVRGLFDGVANFPARHGTVFDYRCDPEQNFMFQVRSLESAAAVIGGACFVTFSTYNPTNSCSLVQTNPGRIGLMLWLCVGGGESRAACTCCLHLFPESVTCCVTTHEAFWHPLL